MRVMAIHKPTLGGDPEFFVYVKDGQKLLIKTADKFLPPKATPGRCYHYNTHNNMGTYHFDGVQAEVNPAPFMCREDLLNSTYHCLREVYEQAKEQLKTKDIFFLPYASIKVTPDDIKDTDMECRRFGCSPDANIYDEKKIDYPDGNVFMTRFSGGHIHLGFDQIQYAEKFRQPGKLLSLIKALDYIPGLIFVAISPGEEEKIRRQCYGKAGTYRIQKHGLEYRTLSSSWLVSPPLTSLAFGLSRDAFLIVYHDLEKELFSLVEQNEVRRIINEVDAKAARDIFFNKIKPFYLEYLITKPKGIPDNESWGCLIDNSPYKHPDNQTTIDKIIKESYKAYFDPMDTVDYWRLTKDLGMFNSGYGIASFSGDIKLRGTVDSLKRLKGEI